jgi:hypothetical protein
VTVNQVIKPALESLATRTPDNISDKQNFQKAPPSRRIVNRHGPKPVIQTGAMPSISDALIRFGYECSTLTKSWRERYLANSTARVSRMTLTLICPG